ncbi:MAG TPA: hypothetical protein VGP93_09610, partial [Polyangiaceae bacterium]|nr:hypothetical protein [Polyangiaceae bacterium]
MSAVKQSFGFFAAVVFSASLLPGCGSGSEKSGAAGSAGGAGGSVSTGGSSGGPSSSGGSSLGGTSASSGGSGPAAGGANSAGAAGSAGSAGASAGPWRPFSDDSPWNTLIAADPEIDPDSDSLINDFTASSQWPFLGINIDGFSVPLYWADASTPLETVTAELGGEGFQGDNGFNASAMVPIPAGAAPDPESDAHMLIVDRTKAMEWGFFGTKHDAGQWTAALGATADLTGSGVHPPDVGNATWWTSHAPRACGFPLVAGLIRVEEMQAGVINHALVIAYPHIRAGFYTPPASTSQAANGIGADSTRGIPCGGRIELDPSLDLETLGLTDSG